jgi:hypothetical protein
VLLSKLHPTCILHTHTYVSDLFPPSTFEIRVFDELAETDGGEELQAWLSKLIGAKQDIVAFITHQLESDMPGDFDSYRKGSFNLSLVFKLGNDCKVLIRFPKPGHTATTLREDVTVLD